MTGATGATDLVNGADVTGATGDVKPIVLDVGSEILSGRGMEIGVGLATGAGAEKLSGVVTGAGAEISNGAEIWMREVAGRDFGTEVAWVLEVGRMVALFLSDSRSESKEMVTFFVVAVGAGVAYEAGAEVRMSETAENSSEKTILRGALTK
jgi:hypothetical protein